MTPRVSLSDTRGPQGQFHLDTRLFCMVRSHDFSKITGASSFTFRVSTQPPCCLCEGEPS